MRGTLAVYKRELALYFRSPIAYAIAFALLGFIGLLFSASVIQAVNANITPNQFGQQQQIPAMFVLNATNLLTFLMFLVGPLITMRLIAEENREGTLEVLMTLPMNESAFIAGKFLAAWTYYTVLLLLTLSQVWMVSWIGVPDYGVIFTSYLGAWLYGGAVLAICLIWSAVTEDQVVAAFLGAATVLVLYLSDAVSIYLNTLDPTQTNNLVQMLINFFGQIGINAHYQSTLAAGLIRAQDIAYYILVIVGALFITTRLVETRRWRG